PNFNGRVLTRNRSVNRIVCRQTKREGSSVNTDICFFVKKLDHHISRRFYSMYSRKALEECSMSNVWIVDYLYDHRDRDVFQKEIEDKFFVNRATVSKMLKLMEEKKLICRMPSAADS